MRIIPDPVAGFKAHNVPATAEAADDTKYYGFVSTAGDWYIMQEVVSTGVYRFCYGNTAYADAWTNRATQTYDLLSVVWPS